MSISMLEKLKHSDQFDLIDLQFARLMTQLSKGSNTDEIAIAAAFTHLVTARQRHICLSLETIAGKSFNDIFPELRQADQEKANSLITPGLEAWLKALHQSPAVGKPGEYAPLIIDNKNRLYLYRYWQYENELALSIKERLDRPNLTLDTDILKKGLNGYFGNKIQSVDWQKIAAAMALKQPFSVITGGPGTGKTHTVTAILALLLDQNPKLKINICAPTGKAAARLQDSIKKAKKKLECKKSTLDLIPESASTIHRLLGTIKGSPNFRHNKKNPLATDVVIVDEASMVSLALMSKLMQAIPLQAKVILLGDKNQLSSVEAGAVFSNIGDAGEASFYSQEFTDWYCEMTGEKFKNQWSVASQSSRNNLADIVTELKHSYRFEESPLIGKVSSSINCGEVSQTISQLNQVNSSDAKLRVFQTENSFTRELSRLVDEYYLPIVNADSVEEAMKASDGFKILCSHRLGSYGVDQVNAIIEEILISKNMVDSGVLYFRGKPVIIKQNDYNLGLYNGDTGLIWEDEDGNLKAFFKESENRLRSFSPNRLPKHQPVFALTIHESQGSEYEKIVMILSESGSSLLTRELLYTGLTRARQDFEIWGREEILKAAISKRVERASGLTDALISP